MRLIAFFGPKRSGKDECARIVVDLVNPRPFMRIEFTEPIRWGLEEMGVPRAVLRERKDEPCVELDGRTGREAMVAVGNAITALAPGLFARSAIRRAEGCFELDEHDAVAAISDGRKVVEARAVREAGGLCVWVHRPEAHQRRAEDVVLEPEAHALCHHEVQNTGDLDHLRAEVRRVLVEAGVLQ